MDPTATDLEVLHLSGIPKLLDRPAGIISEALFAGDEFLVGNREGALLGVGKADHSDLISLGEGA